MLAVSRYPSTRGDVLMSPVDKVTCNSSVDFRLEAPFTSGRLNEGGLSRAQGLTSVDVKTAVRPSRSTFSPSSSNHSRSDCSAMRTVCKAPAGK